MSEEKSPRRVATKHTLGSLGLNCFCAGLAASMADAATHPLELVKIRLQIQGERRAYQALTTQGLPCTLDNMKYRGFGSAILKIAREEGPLTLYNGLFASVQRQLFFASMRIGMYHPVKNQYTNVLSVDNKTMSATNFGIRVLAATSVCCVAVAATQPMDVVKLRLQAMMTGPGVRARYTSTLDAYRKIARQEGLRGMWKGTLPNMTRNCVCSTSELVTYDITKEALMKYGFRDNLMCHFISALCSGFVASILTSPVDVVKTRIMNSSSTVYRGTFHCGYVMLREEGVTAFYKGFVPLYCRIGSWSLVMFLCYEQLQKAARHLTSTYM